MTERKTTRECYTWTQRPGIAFLTLLSTILISSACGGNVRQIADRSIEISYHTLKSAETTYHIINEGTQSSIIDDAKTEKEAEEKLRVHREKARKVYKAFAIAYTSIGVASTALAFADIGKLDTAGLIQLVINAKTAVEQVVALIKQE